MKTSFQQVLQADREVFTHMIRNDVKVRRQSDNTVGMDTTVFAAISSYEVAFNLMPLPKQADNPASSQPSNPSSKGSSFHTMSLMDRGLPYRKGKGKGKDKNI